VRAPFAAIFVLVLVLSGCGGNGKPKPISGPAKEAASVVQALEKATARRDFRAICDRLLTASERRQAGGSDCPRLMAQRAQGLQHPRIRIRGIEIARGNAAALVSVQTTAVGQAPAGDVIRLVREGGRFRIASLGR
jgi:hypothetical protein